MIYLKDILYVYIVSQFYQLIFSQFLLKNKWNVILYEERKKREKKKKIETEQRSCTMKTEFREVKGTGVVRPPRRQQPRRSATTRDPFSPNHGRLPSETPVRNAKRERHWSSGTKMDRREGEERKGDGKGKRKGGGEEGGKEEKRRGDYRNSSFLFRNLVTRENADRGYDDEIPPSRGNLLRNTCLGVERGIVAVAKFKIRARPRAKASDSV